MKTAEIKALFPIEVEITKEDRAKADERGGQHRLGGVLLERVLPEILHEDIFWGLSIGTVKGAELKTETTETHNGKKIKVPIYMDKNFTGDKIKFELRNS